MSTTYIKLAKCQKNVEFHRNTNVCTPFEIKKISPLSKPLKTNFDFIKINRYSCYEILFSYTIHKHKQNIYMYLSTSCT